MKQIKLPKQVSEILAKFAIVGKHHFFISIIVLLVAISYVVYVMNDTLSNTRDQAYYEQRLGESLKANFDKDTIQKIQNLQKSDEHSAIPPEIPAGTRTNPFAE